MATRPGPPRAVVTGVVRAVLPRALYRVQVDGDRDVVAHVMAGTQKNFVRLVVGDRVELEMSPLDHQRGRVVRKV